jgi:hypothetical protein
VQVPVVLGEAIIKNSETGLAQDTVSTETGKDITLTAVPYFFNITAASEAVFEWTLEGQNPVSFNDQNPDKFSLKIPKTTLSETIQKTLNLLIKEKKNESRQASATINIEIK